FCCDLVSPPKLYPQGFESMGTHSRIHRDLSPWKHTRIRMDLGPLGHTLMDPQGFESMGTHTSGSTGIWVHGNTRGSTRIWVHGDRHSRIHRDLRPWKHPHPTENDLFLGIDE
uniref:Uncharacterized protein n=1 Tax=Malurus cyaneus samueli TaxID=2593467 RepID=A0A8C5T7T1_9PASS